jgi:hypothetical protein
MIAGYQNAPNIPKQTFALKYRSGKERKMI